MVFWRTEMTLGQAFLEALESLAGNKMRSGLTVLGIVIGVAAVIAMLAIGNGAEQSITGSITSIGTNLLFVFRGNMGGGGPGQAMQASDDRPLTMADAEAIADPLAAPSVLAVAPALQTGGTLTYGRESTSTTIMGVTAAEQAVSNYLLTEGEFVNEEHVLGRASVVVLGPETADNLFGYHDGIVGETIRIEGQPFRVIGVLESRGGSMFGSQDDQAFIPFSTAQARLTRRAARDEVDIITVQAISAESVPQASEEITRILRERQEK